MPNTKVSKRWSLVSVGKSRMSMITVNYWVQLYKHDRWNDCWKHASLEDAQKNMQSANAAWPDAEYRIVKREISEEIL